jgi:phosphoribosylformimino-5-aminoimidazole carboxamide ribotide isomerase
VFRPCIDLHEGRVKQLVGGTLTDAGAGLRTNFVAEHDAAWFAARFRDDGLRGGHVIQLGPGNEAPARRALAAHPGGLHLGGGVTPANAAGWLDAGASHVIVTSFLFDGPRLDRDRLAAVRTAVGRGRLVLDLSCRRVGDDYVVHTDRWQTPTDAVLSAALLDELAGSCAEFLVHGVDVEGLRGGVDRDLVEQLGRWAPIPTTYAGGARSLDDLELVAAHGLHLTYGSALDLFGGDLPYADVVAASRRLAAAGPPLTR